MFRVTRPTATPGDVKTLIMEAIKKGGPLNERLCADKIFDVFMDRLVWPEIKKSFALLRKLTYEVERQREKGPVEPDVDVKALHARWEKWTPPSHNINYNKDPNII